MSLVSTHSHPKAAACDLPAPGCPPSSFNTQPPEGGCVNFSKTRTTFLTFQHTATRRRLLVFLRAWIHALPFQHTAARRRLHHQYGLIGTVNSFNTQPPEGGCKTKSVIGARLAVSTHSRPKAAARSQLYTNSRDIVSTHSRPKAAAGRRGFLLPFIKCFNTQPPEGGCDDVLFLRISS